jgi:hypothetical protein
MTPFQALHALETILDMLERLLPGFHTLPDHADLTEARAAIQDVHARLERELMADSTLRREDTP